MLLAQAVQLNFLCSLEIERRGVQSEYGGHETECFIRVAVPVGTNARLKNRHRARKRMRKLVQSAAGSPWAAPGCEGRPHRCEMHLIYVRKLPINWRNRQRTRRDSTRKSRGNARCVYGPERSAVDAPPLRFGLGPRLQA